MIEIAFSSSFKRAFKKQIKNRPDTEAKFWRMTELFIKDPFDQRLQTHKLSGRLKDLWSFTVEYDLRVIFHFVKDNKAVFVNIGKHEEVY
jgi:addiction module RelE/StbE family toxin